MKEYLILKDFDGTHDGIAPAERFVAGEVKRLSKTLVASLGGPEGEFIRDAAVASSEIAKAPPEMAAAVSDVIASESKPTADDRDTKIVAPEEPKPKATLKLNKK